jgi:hypothetical protein
MVSAVGQLQLVSGGYSLPVDPVRLADENCFEVRYILSCLELGEDQIAAAEEAVALVRKGEYGRAA